MFISCLCVLIKKWLVCYNYIDTDHFCAWSSCHFDRDLIRKWLFNFFILYWHWSFWAWLSRHFDRDLIRKWLFFKIIILTLIVLCMVIVSFRSDQIWSESDWLVIITSIDTDRSGHGYRVVSIAIWSESDCFKNNNNIDTDRFVLGHRVV